MYLRSVDASEALKAADLKRAEEVYREILEELKALNDPAVNDKIAAI
ncbi:hypothetical protein CKA32_005104 [Geitlerinema sp. FC II]|nr:hypothetical protein [Geitlerinema sp. CS-897]PPT06423.1 hypothetical protein CKA32_005104 [Geitlerinema sp. FC II]